MPDQSLSPEVPPTEHDAMEDTLLGERPRWPKVIGIISIFWGSLGLTCAGCGALGPSIFFPMLQSAAKAQSSPLPPTMQFGPLQWANIAIGACIAVLLLISGVVLVNRRPAARAMHLIYSVAAISGGAFGLYIQVQANQAMRTWVQQNPSSPFAQGNQSVNMLIGFAKGILFGFAWPIFCLVWFGLIKPTPESMTGGIDEPAA